jgi:PTH1 family peptidyl-tRNA hydrolase
VNIIVGLGNPGQTYHGTRHNVGFAVVQALADRHEVQLTHRILHPADGRPAGVFGDYEAGGKTVRLLMPLTMMNESGTALGAVDAAREEWLLVCDDASLPLGTLRLRAEGGAGGHHGLQSCLEALGTERVPRLRLGVGAPDMPRDLTDFVLSPFRGDERPVVRRMVAQALEACEAWVTEGMAAAMNRYNKAQET